MYTDVFIMSYDQHKPFLSDPFEAEEAIIPLRYVLLTSTSMGSPPIIAIEDGVDKAAVKFMDASSVYINKVCIT